MNEFLFSECFLCMVMNVVRESMFSFVGTGRIIYLYFYKCFRLSRSCKECTLEFLENYKWAAQGVCENSSKSSVRSVPGGNTIKHLKLRSDSVRSTHQSY
jgi:hypothetical protein